MADNTAVTLLGVAGVGLVAYLIIKNSQPQATVTATAPVGTTSAQGASDGTTSVVSTGASITPTSVTQTQATGNTISTALQQVMIQQRDQYARQFAAAAAAQGMTVPQYQAWLQIQAKNSPIQWTPLSYWINRNQGVLN